MHPDYEEVRRLRSEGWTWRRIAQHFGMCREGARTILGVPDKRSKIPEQSAFELETPEQRAFRRFPIIAHKPGPG
jgi:hypothetical protein